MKFTIERKPLLAFIHWVITDHKIRTITGCVRFSILQVQSERVFVTVTDSDFNTWGVGRAFKLQSERFLPGEIDVLNPAGLQTKLESIPAECVTFEFTPTMATVSGGAFTYALETIGDK